MNYRSFPKLVEKPRKGSFEANPGISVLGSLTNDEFKGKFLCRVERIHAQKGKREQEYRIYDSLDAFIPTLKSEYNKVRKGYAMDDSGYTTCFHEVILDTEQKLKLDIDCDIDVLDAVEIEHFDALENPIKTFLDLLAEVNGDLDSSESELPFDTQYVMNTFIERDRLVIDETNEDQMEEFDTASNPEVIDIMRACKFKLVLAEIVACINKIYGRNYRPVADSVKAPRTVHVDIFDSSSAGVKYSAHAIVQGIYVKNTEQANVFNTMLRQHLWNSIGGMLDTVDKVHQSLRTVWSAKNGERLKKLPSTCDISDAFVTQFDRDRLFELPHMDAETGFVDMAKTKGAKKKGATGSGGNFLSKLDGTNGIPDGINVDFDIADVRHAITSIEDSYPEFKLRGDACDVRDSHYINFNRSMNQPSHCEWCDVMHHHDHNLWAKMKKLSNTIFVTVGCAKYKTRKEMGTLGENAEEYGSKQFMTFTSITAPPNIHNPAKDKMSERALRTGVEMFRDTMESSETEPYRDLCISSHSRSKTKSRSKPNVVDDGDDGSDSEGSDGSESTSESELDESVSSEKTDRNAGSRADDIRAAAELKQDQKWSSKPRDDSQVFIDDPDVQCMIYDEPELRAYDPDFRTLVIHAPMKIGKTKKLQEFLKTNYANDLLGQKIIFISFRQTFTANVKSRFPDFEAYSDSRGTLNANRVIVQMESLHRLVLSDTPPALVILDECESIFEQVDSGLHKEFNDAFAKFEYLLRVSTNVILMDANVSARTYEIIKYIRGTDGMQYHRNAHRNSTDDTYYMTADDSVMYLMMRNDIVNEGKKVAFVTNSIAAARSLEHVAKKEWGLDGGEIMIYTSKTPASIKKQHFGNVDHHWSSYKMLIYTPTVSAGVSYEVKKEFHKIYAYFTDASCGAETCIQMLGRIRNLIDKTYVICIRSTFRNQPTTVSAIIEQWADRRKNLLENCNEYVHFRYGRNGEPEIKKTVYFVVYSQNLIQRNISRNHFVARFAQLITQYGAKIEVLRTETALADIGNNSLDVKEIKDKLKEARGEIEEEDNERIANAIEITDAEYEEIAEKMRSNETDVCDDEYARFKKKALRKFYRHEAPKPITTAFVKKYESQETKTIFRNLAYVICPDMEDEETYLTPKEKIDELRSREIDEYQKSMVGTNEASARELRYKYISTKHHLSMQLVNELGWHHFMDTARHHNVDHMFERLTLPETIDTLVKLWREFDYDNRLTRNEIQAKIRGAGANKQIFVRDMIKKINNMYETLYGLRIVQKKDKDDDDFYYFLNFRELFAFPDEYGTVGFGEDVPRLDVRKRYHDGNDEGALRVADDDEEYM